MSYISIPLVNTIFWWSLDYEITEGSFKFAFGHNDYVVSIAKTTVTRTSYSVPGKNSEKFVYYQTPH